MTFAAITTLPKTTHNTSTLNTGETSSNYSVKLSLSPHKSSHGTFLDSHSRTESGFLSHLQPQPANVAHGYGLRSGFSRSNSQWETPESISIAAYHWLLHDVTKIQNKKLSILPRFYFHYALEQLKTTFHTNFRFIRVLGFVREYAWISKLLRDAAFTWRPRELSCRLKNDLFQEILLSKQFMY